MVEDDHEEPTWDTTEAVAVIEDAARRAKRQGRISEAVSQAVGAGDITEARLPLKVVIGLVLWVVSQARRGDVVLPAQWGHPKPSGGPAAGRGLGVDG